MEYNIKRKLSILALIISIPSITYAGWFGDLFSKKPTTTIQQDSKQTNNNTNTVQNSQKVDNQFVGGAVNIPENQKSHILNFSEIKEIFQPPLIQSVEVSKSGVLNLEKLILSVDKNATALILSQDKNSTSLVTQIKDISGTLKAPPNTKVELVQDTKTYLDTFKQNVISPLETVGSRLSEISNTLSINNSALINAINNMSSIPSSGGSSVDTVQNLNATGNVTAWASVVTIGATPLTANATITIPTAVGNIGKTIKFIRVDNTAFTVTLAGQAGETITTLNNGAELNTSKGALTLEATTATEIRQESNIGQSPVSVDTAFGTKSADQTGISAATDVTWSSAGTVVFAANSWTLTAGKTYWLEAMLVVSNNSANSAAYAWVDSGNAIITGTTQGNTKSPTGLANGSSQSNAAGYFTPTVDTIVKVRVMFVSGTMSIAGGVSADSSQGSSWADIRQVGVSAIAGGAQKPVTLTTVGTSGLSTFNQGTGALNIPNYTAVAVPALEYIQVSNTAVSVTAVAGQSLKFTNIVAGNIPYTAATGQFTLTAGKTYLMRGLLLNGPGSAYWYNVTGATAISQVGTAYVAASANAEAEVFFTPAVNSVVEFRSNTTASYSSANGLAAASTRASIMQIR